MAGITELAPGAIFAGDYRIVRTLSRGGMGVVYVAEQLSIGVKRALKLMHADLVPHESLLRLFKQEARIGHLIHSDHIVKVIDAGVDTASGSPWLAMELLEGEVLSLRLLREPLLPHREAVEILRQVCNALAAAHDAGVVHRDLKPENLFLAGWRTDAPPTVKVLDLGIAKLLAEATLQGKRTATGTMAIGTPLWMAPEQATGELISAATDVWAIGLLAFRLLTGRCYWTTAESHNSHAILQELLDGPMASASARASEYGCADRIPAAFDGWFARCVARSRVDRFEDARAARERMMIALDMEPSTLPSAEVVRAVSPSQPPSVPIVPPQPPGAAYDPRWYVPRQREEVAALNYLAFPGTPAVLVGPKRFGKTWLLNRCLTQLRKRHGYESLVVNCRLLNLSSLDLLVQSLSEQISNVYDVPPLSVECVSRRPGSEMGKLTWMMDHYVLPEVKSGLVLALDDVDLISGSTFQDDFFALLRSWAENSKEPWPRLRLVLAVSTTPALLITDPNRSPFNLTSPILLDELSVAQVEELARRYGVTWSAADIERVMALVGGHPYLIRLLMHGAALHKTPLPALLDPSSGAGWILAKEVGRIRAWFGRSDLLDVTARIARDPGCALGDDELDRLTHAGVVVEPAPGIRRLRHGLFVLAALARA